MAQTKDSLTVLNSLPRSEDNIVSVYFPKFKDGFNLTATVNTDKEGLTNTLRHLQGALKLPHIKSVVHMYRYKDNYLDITNGKTHNYYSKKEVYNCQDNKIFATVNKSTSINREQFPIINCYSSVVHQRIRSINYNTITVHFIEETSESKSDEPVHFIKVDYVNKDQVSLDACKEIINLIVK